MLTLDEQREVMRQDRRRRRQREQREAIELWLAQNPASAAYVADKTKQYAHVNKELVRGIGIISPPVHTSASVDSFARSLKMTRTVGVAPGTNASDGPTYRAIYADGTSEILPVPSRKRAARTNGRHSVKGATLPKVAEVVTHAATLGTQADYD